MVLPLMWAGVDCLPADGILLVTACFSSLLRKRGSWLADEESDAQPRAARDREVREENSRYYIFILQTLSDPPTL